MNAERAIMPASLETKQSICLADEKFNAARSNAYHLTLLLGPGEVAWTALDIRNKEFVYFESHRSETSHKTLHYFDMIRETTTDSPVRFCKWKSVGILLNELKSAVIPAPLFNPKDKFHYLGLTTPVKGNEILYEESIPNAEAVNVFALDANTGELFATLFGAFTIRHISTVLIDRMTLGQKHRAEKKVFVYVSEKRMELLVTDDRNLLLHNRFSFDDSETFAYYILSVFEQLGLHPEKIPVTIAGHVKRNDEKYLLLCKYIRYLEWADRPDIFSYSHKFHELEPHFYYPLFCEPLYSY